MATNPLQRLTFGAVITTVLLSLIVVQILVKLSAFFFGTGDYRFGWIITFILVALAVIIVSSIVLKSQGNIDRRQIVTILVLTGLTIMTIIYMPKVLPQIFSALPIYNEPVTQQGLQQLQSIVSP